MSVDAVDPTPLFPDDETYEGATLHPANTADIAQKLWIIKKIRAKALKVREQAVEAQLFYVKRLDSLSKQCEWIQGQIDAYLTLSGENSIATHNGTAMYVTRSQKTWPDEKVLLDWAKAHSTPDVSLIRTTEVPDKKACSEAITSGITPPEGYTVVIQKKLEFRGLDNELAS